LSFTFGAALLTSVIGAGPASAHAVLVKMTPAANAQLTAAPSKVVVQFDEPVSTNFATVVVTTAAGVSVAKGKASVLGAKVTQALSPDMASGDYRIAYQVTSDDGHPVNGQSRFTLKLAAGASTANPSGPTSPPATVSSKASSLGASTTADQGGGSSGYLLPLAIGVVVLAIGAGVLLSRRRRG
jgi:methionine-rich copper-binding protein CopC